MLRPSQQVHLRLCNKHCLHCILCVSGRPRQFRAPAALGKTLTLAPAFLCSCQSRIPRRTVCSSRSSRMADHTENLSAKPGQGSRDKTSRTDEGSRFLPSLLLQSSTRRSKQPWQVTALEQKLRWATGRLPFRHPLFLQSTVHASGLGAEPHPELSRKRPFQGHRFPPLRVPRGARSCPSGNLERCRHTNGPREPIPTSARTHNSTSASFFKQTDFTNPKAGTTPCPAKALGSAQAA